MGGGITCADGSVFLPEEGVCSSLINFIPQKSYSKPGIEEPNSFSNSCLWREAFRTDIAGQNVFIDICLMMSQKTNE